MSVTTIFALPALTVILVALVSSLGVKTVFSNYIYPPSLYVFELMFNILIGLTSKIMDFIIPIFAIDLAIFAANQDNEMFEINRTSSVLFKIWCISGISAIFFAVSLGYLTDFLNLLGLNLSYSNILRLPLLGLFLLSGGFKIVSKRMALKINK